MDSKAPNGPAQIEIWVQMIREDGSQRTEATIGMRYGKYPTPAEIQARIEKFEREEMPKHAPGFRLQTARELWDTACEERTGQTFACPPTYDRYQPVE